MYLKLFAIYFDEKSTGVTEPKYIGEIIDRIYFVIFAVRKFLRKIRFETDGTFEEFWIHLGMSHFEVKMYPTVPSLCVDAPFDLDLYLTSDDKARCKYYVDLVRHAFTIASNVKPLPLAEILCFLDTLEINNYTYSWDFKSLIDWERNIKIKQTASLNTHGFFLNAQVFTRKPKSLICEGMVLYTEPFYSYFDFLNAHMILEGDRIYFRSPGDTNLIYVEIKSMLDGQIKAQYVDGIKAFWKRMLKIPGSSDAQTNN